MAPESRQIASALPDLVQVLITKADDLFWHASGRVR
jgi:hypothetical protein